jgi:ABC-2 type transport system permease protein
MTSTATLAWFARHELTLAWRDWVAMMSGGRTVREHAITIGTLVFVGLLHWLAYAILSPILANGVIEDKATLVLLTAMLLAAFSMMLSQSIEQVTRAFYARADLDLILSSPAASQHLFAVRIGAVAFAGTAMTSLLAAPFINMAAYISGGQWLGAYLVIAALSMIATAISVVGATALFKAFGPKRTRTIAQIIAAVVGAALLIGLQVAAILAYGNLSRFTVLRSEAMIGAAPDPASVAWLPAKALLGEPLSLIALVIFATAILAAAIAYHAGEFANHAVAAASSAENTNKRSSHKTNYKHRTMAQALRAKEWILLKRDPWLASQTLMQVLYLLPPALLLWRDMGPNTQVDVILAPVLVMAFGQLAGGLAWLAISGEDAPELVATAPLNANAVLRAKIEAVLAVIAVCAAPFILGLTIVSVVSACLTSLGIVAASCSAIAIQLWFKTAAKRSQFRRRQTASRAATFAEAFCSIFWAAAAGFAVAGYAIVAIAFTTFAIGTMAIARGISPRT